jgi:predicted esterase
MPSHTKNSEGPNFLTRFVLTFIALPLLSIGMLISYPFRILLFPFRLLIGLFTGTAGEQIKSLQESVKNYFNEVKSRGFFGGLAYILLTPLVDAVNYLFGKFIFIDITHDNDNYSSIMLDNGKELKYCWFCRQSGGKSEYPEETHIICFPGNGDAYSSGCYSDLINGHNLREGTVCIVSPVRPMFYIDKEGDIQRESPNVPKIVEYYKEFIIKYCQKEGITSEQAKDKVVLHGFSWGGAEAIATSHALEKAGWKVRANIIQSGASIDTGKTVAHNSFLPAEFYNFALNKELKFANSKDEREKMLGNKNSPPIYFVHGDKDGMIPIEHAEKQYEQCSKSGRDTHFNTLTGDGHYIHNNKIKSRCVEFALNKGKSSTKNIKTEPTVLRACKAECISETRDNNIQIY